MNKITSKEDIKLFRKEIKKELKKFLSYVEDDNLDDIFGFELMNDGDDYICHIFSRVGMHIPYLDRVTNDSITVTNFMYGNGFNLNKHTTDYQLKKVVDRIIDEYNNLVVTKSLIGKINFG